MHGINIFKAGLLGIPRVNVRMHACRLSQQSSDLTHVFQVVDCSCDLPLKPDWLLSLLACPCNMSNRAPQTIEASSKLDLSLHPGVDLKGTPV